jgi:nitroreductase
LEPGPGNRQADVKEKVMNKPSTIFDEPPVATSSAQEIAQFVVEAAVHAPSVHNTQPWWFYGADHEVGIHADDERRLAVADPDGREMMISCGAALFTARVAMRYCGLVPKVTVFPETGVSNVVARIRWAEVAAPLDYERELFAEIPRRRTHRGAFDSESLPDGINSALRYEVEKEGAKLAFLNDEARQNALAGVVEAGEYATRANSARARELAKWAPGPGSARQDGVPATAYPARPDRMEPNFPARDFAHGHDWGRPPTGIGQLEWSAGCVTILATAQDRPEDWVAAGQALQRMLLFAASCGISAALHSQPLEIPQLRDFIKGQFCDGAYPQLIVRLGVTNRAAYSVRRPVGDVLF